MDYCVKSQKGIEIIGMIKDINKIEKNELTNYLKILMVKVVELINNDMYEWLNVRQYFIEQIGYAIPSKKAIDTLANWISCYLEKNPTAKFIDVGAGSGIWELLLHDKDIDKDKLVAIDLPQNMKKYKFAHTFWPIEEMENYNVNHNDILFNAWGCGGQLNILKNYINNGGQMIILLGENGGCTSPSADHFIEDDNWIVEMVNVTGNLSCLGDFLTLNTPNNNSTINDRIVKYIDDLYY